MTRTLPGNNRGVIRSAATYNEFHGAVGELARRAHAETRPHYEPIAAEFAALGSTYVPAVDYAGALLLLGKAGWRAVSEAPGGATVVEQLHEQTGEGPAIDAACARGVVRVDDVATETRWPRFIEGASSRSPVRAILCCPLYTHVHTWGALILLAEQPHSLDEDVRQVGMTLATHTALALDAIHHDRHYRSALGSRDIIGQAKGILMERLTIDAGAAFAVLTRLAEQSHRPVVVVAKEVLEHNCAGDL